MSVFFFYHVRRQKEILEPSIGPCMFCKNKEPTVDLIHRTNRYYILGCIPTGCKHDEELAACQKCHRGIKPQYYTLRTNAKTKEALKSGYEGDEVPVIVGEPVE